jgi:hypothetical protein
MKERLIDQEKKLKTIELWRQFTKVSQEMILVAYGLAAMDLIAKNPGAAEIICHHEGGGPSWSKSNSPWQRNNRWVLLVDWVRRSIQKSSSGCSDLIVSEYGHFAQVLIWLNDLYQSKVDQPHARFDIDSLIACALENMQEAVGDTYWKAVNHAATHQD